ncbi:V-type ATP synthase subunit I [bacterium SCSIO 12741]|nr:V-type ATP synthase subunit I [bacterium SCSIO 12741]
MIPHLKVLDLKDTLVQLDQLKKEKKSLENEKQELETRWGHFSSQQIEQLQQWNLYLQLYQCKKSRFKSSWKEEYAIEVLDEGNDKICFALIHEEEEGPQLPVPAIPLPVRGPVELEKALSDQDKRIAVIEDRLEEFAYRKLGDLRYTYAVLNDRYELKATGQQKHSWHNGSMNMVEAWIPKAEEEETSAALNEAGIYFETEQPVPEEKTPILLRNKKVSSLFEPIGSLFSLPEYTELDLTPFFAPFFLMFFGFCLGDAGYGLVLLLALLLFGKKLGPENKGIVRLAQLLGLSTVAFGILTGTVFGVNLIQNPPSWLEGYNSFMLVEDQLFNLALAFGGVQIIFGLVIKMVNQKLQYGWIYTVSTGGWILLIIGLGLVGGSAPETMIKKIGAGSSLLGAGLILFFNDPKANILVRIGKGLWELYGITGVFGDLLSYIRLFALGLSSAILGLVINSIGLSILESNPYLGPVFFVIFLIIGHGLNFFIAGLGAFVHPMRLTFVEFYKNAGFTGGGMAYKPFKKHYKNDKS